MKKCRLCNTEKDESMFYPDKRLRSGLMACCKECCLRRQKTFRTKELTRRYNKTGREKIRNNPEKWSDFLKKQRDYYKIHGRKKHPNKCVVCGSVFMSVRKDKKFCSAKCISFRENNGRWNGGRHKVSSGYIMKYCPDHPNRVARSYVLEHRLVMEKHLGRLLTDKEVVHHIDGNRTNNSIENLQLFSSTAEHSAYHWKIK